MNKIYQLKTTMGTGSWLLSVFICSCFLPFTSAAQLVPDGCEKFFGNVYSSRQLTDFTDYWNQVTPENAGKWGSVEGTRDVMNWDDLDAAYALAKDNGFPFRFHVLLWGNQQPDWIRSLPVAEQLEEIEEWFAAVAERYLDIDYLEVVNEPTNDPPIQTQEDIRDNRVDYGGYAEALGGPGDSGWDWILTSYRIAREYFPNTKLVLNDFNVTNTTANAEKYVSIINLLKAEGLLDIVGIQGHAFETYYAPPSETLKNLNIIADTGFPIMVTEMDIEGVGSEAASDSKQLAEYQEIFPIFWEHPSVMGITLWGWRTGLWRSKANLVTSTGAERPAFTWLKNYLQNEGAVFCGGTPETPETPTGIKESKLQEEIYIYPNPSAKGSFTLELTNERYDQVRVLDYSGKVISTTEIKGKVTPLLDLDLKPGIYMVQLVNSRATASKKLMVK